MKKLVEAFRNIFSTPDLRNRVLFTLALLGVYRLGAFIPTPGIDVMEMRAKARRGRGLDVRLRSRILRTFRRWALRLRERKVCL